MKYRPSAVLASVLFILIPFLLNVDAAPTLKDSFNSKGVSLQHNSSPSISDKIFNAAANSDDAFTTDIAYWKEFFERKPRILHALNIYLSKFPPPPPGFQADLYYSSLLSKLNEALAKEQEGVSLNTKSERPVINSSQMVAE